MKKVMVIAALLVLYTPLSAAVSKKKVLFFKLNNSAAIDASYTSVLPQTVVRQLAKKRYLAPFYRNRTRAMVRDINNRSEMERQVSRLKKDYRGLIDQNTIVVIGDIKKTEPSSSQVTIVMQVIDIQGKRGVQVVNRNRRIKALMVDILDELSRDILVAVKQMYPDIDKKEEEKTAPFKQTGFSVGLTGGYYIFNNDNDSYEALPYIGAAAMYKFTPDFGLSLTSDYTYTDSHEDDDINSIRIVDYMIRINHFVSRRNHSLVLTFGIGFFNLNFLETDDPGPLPGSSDGLKRSQYNLEMAGMVAYYYRLNNIDLQMGLGYKHVFFSHEDLKLWVIQAGVSYNF